MTLTTPKPATDLAHHKKTHLTMSHYVKMGSTLNRVKWDKLFFAIEFDAGSKGALF